MRQNFSDLRKTNGVWIRSLHNWHKNFQLLYPGSEFHALDYWMEKLSTFLDPVWEFPFWIIKKIYCKFNIFCVSRTKWEAVLWQGRLYVSVTQVKNSYSLSPYLFSFFWHLISTCLRVRKKSNLQKTGEKIKKDKSKSPVKTAQQIIFVQSHF